MEKMTYVKALEIALETINDEAVAEKLEALKASISKKNSGTKKPTAQQNANAELKEAIYNEMEADVSYTISDMAKTFECVADISSQRLTALVHQMKADGKVVRSEVKRKAYFTKVGD